MPAPYPFIDVAVHDSIRPRFARGEALVVFSPALDRVLWANGAGARFFGNASIYDFLEEGPNRSDVTFRQIEAVARQLGSVGDNRTLILRVASGFQRVPVTASAEMVEIRQGEPVVLLSLPTLGKPGGLAERAAEMLTGFDDPDTHMAVLGGDGEVIVASAKFAALEITAQTTRTLVTLAGTDADHLVKRPIPTGRGYLPAAIGKLSADPAMHLLFAVETILGTMDPTDHFESAADKAPADDLPAAVAEPVAEPTVSTETEMRIAAGVAAAAESGFAEVVDAIGDIEEFDGDEIEALDETNDEESSQAAPVAEATAPALSEAADVIEAFEPEIGPLAETEIDTIPNLPDSAAEPEGRPPAASALAGDVSNADAKNELEAQAEPLADALPTSALAEDTAEARAPATPAAAIHTGDAPAGSFAFSPERRATRFVWKIDADGRFCDVSGEFAEAVGPRAAAINGVAFADLAALFNLDPDGKIGELLQRRDTWSGKTIYWPVEGTTLMVPVDLAALPTYTRNRDFDGFRGFGIVRMADAIEDPNRTGLTFVESAPHAVSTETETRETPTQPAPAFSLLDELPADEEETDTLMVESGIDDEPETEMASGEPEMSSSDTPSSAELTQGPLPSSTTDDQTQTGEPEIFAPPADMTDVTRSAAVAPPALQISETPGRRHSDKVVQLELRRAHGRDGLTPGEQAAFLEIARKLDPQGLREKAAEALGEIRRHEAAEATRHAVESEKVTPFANADESDHEHVEVSAETPDAGADAAAAAETVLQAPHTLPAQDELAAEPGLGQEDAVAEDFATLRLKRDNTLSAEIVDLMPVALLVHIGERLIHANPEFLNLTGYASVEELDTAGGLDVLIQRQDLEGASEEAGRVVIVRADDRLVPVTARLQSVRFERATALMLALIPAAAAVQGTPEKPAEVEASTVAPLSGGEPQGQTGQAGAEHLARLQVEVDELRSILETATDGVVILEADGDIRSMNRAASALFNFDEAETRGKPFVMLFAHESQKSILDYLGGLSGHGVASVLNDGREVIGREASGGFLPLFMTIGKLTSSNGYCAVIRDITQWKRTEEELRNAKRAAETANAHKSDFLARVSHEIRTPLNAIIGFADMMANEHFGALGHPRYGEYANDIVRSGRHVLDIVNDLLDISKIEAGEMDLDFTAVGLNETVQAAVSIVQPQANGQRVIVRTALSQAVPNVVADMRSIKQIVLNILANAIRFTPSGGQIIVSTAYEANGSVVLRVRDTGVGMTRTELEQAMKPFRQVHTGSRNRGDGTGLGLPLTKAMVDANRANFSISSAPNEGTLVEITFPSQRVLAD
ncbi:MULTISPECIES: ATP-binding protein [Alphaproteobacteria]|uniref:histidine kinase n=2 Tax=Alphaproteobacteria TaxID=28211 RepID=A0A512HIC4_9HYPH|nr:MULTISPECIES: ATP-binding protein [Alphaproteobacteria]GEO85198.1 PAS domain-containing sensor histidine kinase [Ciceribacter naphthalenivorans]GLR24468.1 PAS domain-containing sensor histidine kinase [Ciceribacter naphthalenivorans]GLT07324.1 PAS domain-containing sensor histidine kinase [Sphingomonas psychrolutea]